MIYMDYIDRKTGRKIKESMPKSMSKSICQMTCLWLLTAGMLFTLCGCTKKAETAGELTLLASAEEANATDAENGADEAQIAGVLKAGSDDGITEETAGQQAGNVSEAGGAALEKAEATDCYVHVCGAVKKPGVYCMEQGERIFEAVAAAGGFLEDACEDYVNQAKTVTDGCRIWIPTRSEAKELGWQHPDTQLAADAADGTGRAQAEADTGAVNINTATSAQLCTLSGIGETKAEAIIAYRNAHGAFNKIEDIMKVAGIKQSGYDKIKDQITVGRE